MGWFCTHLTIKNLKFVKILKKTAKKWHFLRRFLNFFPRIVIRCFWKVFGNCPC